MKSHFHKCYNSIFARRQEMRAFWSPHSSIITQSLTTKTTSNHWSIEQARVAKLEQKFNQFFQGNKWHSEAEWDSIKSETLSEQIVSEVGFSGSVMKHCLSENNLVTAKSLISYLNHKNTTANIATLTLFLKLCAKRHDDDNEEVILNAYTDLKKRNIHYNTDILNIWVSALARTKLWTNGIELMKTIEENKEKISNEAYNAFIWAAFKNKRFDLGYEKLKSFHENPSNEVVIEWLKLCEDDESMTTVFKLVDYLSSTKLTVPLSISDSIQSVFNLKNYVGKYVAISHEGYCSHCGNSLQKNVISDAEFAMLRDAIMTSVIKGKDVFRKTDPTELRTFEIFLKNTGPFDIVIDGMNVAYHKITDVKKKSDGLNPLLYQQLIHVIEKLSREGNKILVLGSGHMRQWPIRIMSYIKSLAHCFVPNRLSEDDPFVLYAALASGPQTVFISNDFMRDHTVCLEDELSVIFRNWQWSHQICFEKNEDGEMELRPPPKYKLTAQRTETTVHIPCGTKNTFAPVSTPIPTKWLCCSNKTIL